MKINIESLIIGAAIAAIIIKYTNQPKISGFYASNEPYDRNHPGPLKPYGARWGQPTPSEDVTIKSKMIA